MDYYKNIHPIETLVRITRETYETQVTDIISRIEKDGNAFVITEGDKDSLAICPIHWLTFPLDDDFGCVINSAVRYAIGRHTYMPSVVCDFVRKYINTLDLKTINVMIEDINKELKFGIDQEELWLALRKDLLERQIKILKVGVNKDA